ncbi:TIR domain-containing protein, partial [Phormidesmis sp. 146-33]
MTDVFLSYSRKDKAFVQTLHDALRAEQREIWVDWQAIPLTADWWQEIERGIEGTNTFVFVISPDSVASEVCRDEIDHAVKHNKRLVPIVHREGFEATAVHPMLSKYNWLFFRETDEFDRGFADLVRAIETDLEYVRSHTRLTERAVEWEGKQRNESFLLRGMDLAGAEDWLVQGASKQPQVTELQGEYIQASRLAETQRQRVEARRQRAFVVGVGAFALVAMGAAAFAFQQRQEAVTQKQEAQNKSVEAESQKVEAQKQSQRAEREKQTAQAEKARAEGALKQAEAAKKTAEQRAQETKAALVKVETARQSEVQQRQLAQQRQQEALTAKGVADQKTIEAQQQQNRAETETQNARRATALAEKGRKNSELSAQSLTSLNLLASNLQLESLAEGLKAGQKLKQWEKELDTGTPMQVKATIQHVVYGINERNRMKGHRGWVHSVSFSPDGKTLATGSYDNTVKLWDLQGRELQTLKGHSERVNSVSFSPDGKTLATGSYDNTVKLWDLQGRELQTLKGHSSYVTSVSFSPDGKTLATGS